MALPPPPPGIRPIGASTPTAQLSSSLSHENIPYSLMIPNATNEFISHTSNGVSKLFSTGNSFTPNANTVVRPLDAVLSDLDQLNTRFRRMSDVGMIPFVQSTTHIATEPGITRNGIKSVDGESHPSQNSRFSFNLLSHVPNAPVDNGSTSARYSLAVPEQRTSTGSVSTTNVDLLHSASSTTAAAPLPPTRVSAQNPSPSPLPMRMQATKQTPAQFADSNASSLTHQHDTVLCFHGMVVPAPLSVGASAGYTAGALKAARISANVDAFGDEFARCIAVLVAGATFPLDPTTQHVSAVVRLSSSLTSLLVRVPSSANALASPLHSNATRTSTEMEIPIASITRIDGGAAGSTVSSPSYPFTVYFTPLTPAPTMASLQLLAADELQRQDWIVALVLLHDVLHCI